MLVIQPNFEPIPGYRIIQQLGRGGCGEVWKAEAPGGVFKAIKFVFGDREGIKRNTAEQEQRSLQRVKNIRHPYILSTERFEVVEGQLVIVMELADGSLADRFAECQSQGLPGIPRDELLRYMEEAAEALDLLNSHHQIQHMDIKPQNIFLVQNHAKVGDFGLAKNLEGNRAVLTGGTTPIYASPESFDGWVSRQSDQYSLAIVYQEMLTGTRPFNGASSRQLIMQHLSAVPDLSALSLADRGPVDQALAKVSEERFASCSEFVRALRRASQNPIPAGTTVHTARPHRPVPVRPVALAGVPDVPRAPIPPAAAPRIAPTSPTSVGFVGKPPAERQVNGALFPTLVVGIGTAGAAVIQHFRRLLSDRFRKPTLPHIRWMLLGSDAEALDSAIQPAGDLQLTSNEVLLTELPELDCDTSGCGTNGNETFIASETWDVPSEFAQRRWISSAESSAEQVLPILLSRVQCALTEVSSKDALADSANLTRLDLRSRSPRIYLVGSLAEDVGAALCVDLAYLMRHELRRLGQNPDYVYGLFSLPNDDELQGFLRSTKALAELKYFDRPDSVFHAAFGTEEPAEIADRGRPFGRFVAFDEADAIVNQAHLLLTESLSPAGHGLQSVRSSKSDGHYSAFAVRRVRWPREFLIRSAARRLARDTLAIWADIDEASLNDQAHQAVTQCWRDRRLEIGLVRTSIEYGASQRLGQQVELVVQDVLQAVGGTGRDAPTYMNCEVALNQLAEILGDAQENGGGRIASAFQSRALEIASDIDLKLAPMVASLLERPGHRVSTAGTAIQLLETKLKQELESLERETATLAEEVQNAYTATLDVLNSATPTSKSTRRRPTVSSDFATRANEWAMARIRNLRDQAASMVYWRLLAAIPEFAREVETLADRLDALKHSVDAEDGPNLLGDAVTEYLFPLGAATPNDAAEKLASALGPSGIRDFDEIVQSRLRADGKGILQLVVRPEWGSRLNQFLVNEAQRFMETRTNRTSVSQAFLNHFSSPATLNSYMQNLLRCTNPGWVEDDHIATFVGVPDDAAGHSLADQIRKLAGTSPVTRFNCPDEIVLARLSVGISIDDIRNRLQRGSTAAMPEGLAEELMA